MSGSFIAIAITIALMIVYWRAVLLVSGAALVALLVLGLQTATGSGSTANATDSATHQANPNPTQSLVHPK